MQPDAILPYGGQGDALYRYCRFTSTPLNYTQAQRLCQMHGSKPAWGNLASVLDSAEEAEVAAAAGMTAAGGLRSSVSGTMTRVTKAWLGLDALRAEAADAAMAWRDGSRLGYTNWRGGLAPRLPGASSGGQCAQLSVVGASTSRARAASGAVATTWDAVDCKTELPFVCLGELRTATSLTLWHAHVCALQVWDRRCCMRMSAWMGPPPDA